LRCIVGSDDNSFERMLRTFLNLWTGETSALECHTVDLSQHYMQSDTADSTDLLDLHVSWFILVKVFLETQLVREGFVQACDV